MARDHTIRFMYNNLAIRSSSYYTKSSEVAAYPFSNSQLDKRGKYWKPQGHFLIESTNLNIYINDGSDKTVALTAAAYTSPALLATHIQTQLNASSSSWTCTYSATTFKFTISHTGSATLRYSQTTNASWTTLGFTSATDTTGTSFVADQQRNHTNEYVIWDLTAPRTITFFAAICPIDEDFVVSSSATVRIRANNLNSWTSPPLDVTMTVSNNGIFKFLDNLSDTAYRWWKFEFIDYLNPSGPEAFKFSHIFLGDHLTFDNDRTVSYGFDKGDEDPSVPSEADNGSLYFDTRTKYATFRGLGLELLQRAHKDDLEVLSRRVGIVTPFYMSVDPLNNYTDSLDELTRFVRFSEQPRFRHVVRDLFSVAVSFREAI